MGEPECCRWAPGGGSLLIGHLGDVVGIDLKSVLCPVQVLGSNRRQGIVSRRKQTQFSTGWDSFIVYKEMSCVASVFVPTWASDVAGKPAALRWALLCLLGWTQADFPLLVSSFSRSPVIPMLIFDCPVQQGTAVSGSGIR